MEFKELVKIIKKNSFFLLAAAFTGLIGAVLLTQKLPSGTKANQLIFLSPREESSLAAYRFDGYYSQEKARNFTDTAVAILENTNFAQNAIGSISIKKVAPQLIKITVSAPSPQEAKASLEKADELSRQKIEELTHSSVTTKTIDPSPKVFPFSPSKKIYAAAGVLTGFIFATFVISLKHYFRL